MVYNLSCALQVWRIVAIMIDVLNWSVRKNTQLLAQALLMCGGLLRGYHPWFLNIEIPRICFDYTVHIFY